MASKTQTTLDEFDESEENSEETENNWKGRPATTGVNRVPWWSK